MKAEILQGTRMSAWRCSTARSKFRIDFSDRRGLTREESKTVVEIQLLGTKRLHRNLSSLLSEKTDGDALRAGHESALSSLYPYSMFSAKFWGKKPGSFIAPGILLS